MTLGINGNSITLYRVMFRHACDGVPACAIAANSPKEPANAITETNIFLCIIECDCAL
jgi:hypothetical protein